MKSPPGMFERYVLVDEDTYNRWKSRDERGAAGVNPFQNPHVRDAKRLRREVERVVTDDSLDLNVANERARLLLNDYHREFDRAVGRKTATTSRRGARDSVVGTSSEPPVKKSRVRSPSPLTPSEAAENGFTPRRSRPVSRPVVTSLSDSPFTSPTKTPGSSKKPSTTTLSPSPPTPSSRTTPASQSSSSSKTPSRFSTTESVKRVVGGHLTDKDARAIAPLLEALDEAGYVKNGKLASRVGDDEFSAGRNELVSYIRDVTINEPSRRVKTARQVEAFDRFLKRKGVDFSITPSTARTSARWK
jgi:hypothetical protein